MSSTGGQSPPSLTLSDILVSSPPSIVTSSTNAQVIGKTNVTSIERSGDAAEPLQDDEVAQFRARIEELRLGSQAGDNMSSIEKELLDMVTRLIDAPRPNVSQLEQQANAISELILQRDYLTQQITDERTRMDSERDGFERAAEALIRQRNTKHMYPARYEELERQCAVLQQDNKELRDKEQETQTKLACLESELFKLKPLLLMQPFPHISSLAHTTSYLSSLPYPAPTGSAALNSEKSKAARKRKREKEKAAMQGDDNSDKDALAFKETSAVAGTSNSDGNTDFNVATSSLLDPQRQSGPSIYQHLRPSRNSQQSQSQINQKSKSQRQRSKSPQRSENITSDARAELYVLAARKIGRERASLVSGLIAAEREREKEKFKAAEEEMAKERLAGGHTGYYRNHTSTGGGPKKANKGKTSTSTQKPTSLQNTTTPTTNPQSPKRGVTSAMSSMQFFPHPGSPHPHPHAYMFVPNANMISYQHMHAQPPGAPRIVALAAPFGAHGRMGAPNQVQNSSGQPQPQKPASASPGNPADAGDAASSSKTPLASLLSAARMIDDKGAGDNSASSQRTNRKSNTKRKGANSSEQAENSTAKKRRISSGNTEGSGSTKVAGKRTRSALDVLADQAAAFSQDPEDGEQRGASRKGKGKAKSIETEEPESETETEPSSRVATRRSSRSTRGKRRDMLAQNSLPRIISPAPGREVKKAKMIPPPDAGPSSLLSPPTITVSGSNSTGGSPAEEESRLEEPSRLESVPARVKRLHGNQDPAAERARSREPTQMNDPAPPAPIPIPASEDTRMASPAPQPTETQDGDGAELPSIRSSNDRTAPESTTSIAIVEQSDSADKAQQATNVSMVIEEVNSAITVNTNTAAKTPSHSTSVEAVSQVQVASSQETLASNDDADADGDSDPEVLP